MLSRREGLLGSTGLALASVLPKIGADQLRHQYNFAVANQDELRARSGRMGEIALVKEAGRGGIFAWDGSDMSGRVGLDPAHAIYIAPVNDVSGAKGAWVRQYDGPLLISWFGVTGDGRVDDTSGLVAALHTVGDGQTLDLQGLHLNLFVGVEGTRSGDAVTLGAAPRLFEKHGVTLQNGKLTADRPRPSKSKLRFPSTLTIDGCENTTLKNLVVQSKGENFGDTDASRAVGVERRRTFAAQNGGHALSVIRSLGTRITDCEVRLCGSVGSLYVMSSHLTTIERTFSNPGSLGYAAFAFDSWAGDVSVSGFVAHSALMRDCSAHREGYRFGSKGCVLTEDADVSVAVEGGYFADAYPNGKGRDLGYAFGASSSRTIVRGARVENCASLGYTGTTKPDQHTHLEVINVNAKGLRKTVHQTERTAIGRMRWRYERVAADVAGGGTWKEDKYFSRTVTSYLAMPNGALRVDGLFSDCNFHGATYGFVNDHSCYGSLRWSGGEIDTNGFLWKSANIGAGSPGMGAQRGIWFSNVAIRDSSIESSAYCTTASSRIFTSIDLSSSTIILGSKRPVESRQIANPGKFVERYAFPKIVFQPPPADPGNTSSGNGSGA